MRFLQTRFLASLTSVLGVLGSALAQEAVTIKALCLPKQAAIGSVEMLVGEGKVLELKLQSHEFSLPAEVPRLPVWRFGKSGVDQEGAFTFTTYAEVAPLRSRRQMLVFIRKGPANEDGFRVIPLNSAQFRGKDYMIMNLAPQEIVGVVGTQKFRLKTGAHKLLTPKADRGEGLCFASLLYQRKGEWRSFFSSNWRLREESRSLIFVYGVPGQRAPRLHSVIDPL